MRLRYVRTWQKMILSAVGTIPNGCSEKRLSQQYGIGGYSYTTLTYDFGQPVLGVKTFKIEESGEGMSEITAMNVSGNKVSITLHTNHGKGASGWMAVTANVKK